MSASSPHSVQDDLNLVRQELGIDAGLIADNDVRAAFERLEEHIENFRIHVEREIEPGLVEQLETAQRDARDFYNVLCGYEQQIKDLKEQLEAAITALRVVGDYAFGTWDDDDARLAAGREGEALTRAVLAGSNPASSPETPCSVCGTYGHFTHNHEREVSAPASEPQPDMDLLRKFAAGTGGRRSGDLMRRGWLRVEVTEEGHAALAESSPASRADG